MPDILHQLHTQKPLIHCITNPISITLCANGILAVGGRPMMAEHPKEVAAITATAGALLLNLGNITDVRMESMEISAAAARKAGVPVILDAVGAACSPIRREFALSLLSRYPIAIVKGNDSEILALDDPGYESSGVDSAAGIPVQTVAAACKRLAIKYHCTVLASGKTDIVSDGIEVRLIHNGTAQLASITGTGCLLGALTASFLAVVPPLEAAVTGCCVLGIAGELAQTDKGSGSFTVNLLDELSRMTEKNVENHKKVETSHETV